MNRPLSNYASVPTNNNLKSEGFILVPSFHTFAVFSHIKPCLQVIFYGN